MLVSAIGYLNNKSVQLREVDYNYVSSARVSDSQGFGTFHNNRQQSKENIVSYIKNIFSSVNTVNSNKLDKTI